MFIERICVATDGSDVAVRAAQLSVLLAHTGARRIVALSVAQPHFSMASDAGTNLNLEGEVQRSLKAAAAHVKTVARIAAASGVACESVIRLASAPGPEIVRTAKEESCDLIVMGSHGPNDTNKMFAGSVA
jgi:nucleotide-binding universal stress UspA family protein